MGTTAASIRIVARAFDDPVAVALVRALDADLDARYVGDVDVEGEPDRAFLNLLSVDVAPPRGAFLVAELDGEAVGCGALRGHDPGGHAADDGRDRVAEVKRMFVAPAARGRGLARALLAGLEAEAARLGYARLILETGVRQPEAMALYESTGWTPTANYGAYRSSPLSRCYEKRLTGAALAAR